MTLFRTWIDRVLAWALIGLMGFAVLNVLWQVFTRWVLNDPSSYTEELARYLLIWIGLLGSAYAVSKRLHLAIDLVPTKLEGRRRQMLELFIESVVFLFAFGVMVIGGARLVLLTLQFDQTSAALGIQLGYVYFVVPLSGALIMLYAAMSITERVKVLRRGMAAEPMPDARPGADPTDPSQRLDSGRDAGPDSGRDAPSTDTRS